MRWVVWIAVLLPPLAVPWAAVFLGVRVPDMTRDVAAIAKLPALTGYLSTLGVWLWVASAVLWWVSSRLEQPQPARRVAIGAGLLSAYLALDDQFQFHEDLAPNWLGVPELAVFAVLSVAALMLSWHVWCERSGIDDRWFFAAMLLLAGSMVVDAGERWLWRLGEWQYLLEDGLKWFGQCCWLRWAWLNCAARLSGSRRLPSTAGAAAP